jgi:hypothetical protein
MRPNVRPAEIARVKAQRRSIAAFPRKRNGAADNGAAVSTHARRRKDHVNR